MKLGWKWGGGRGNSWALCQTPSRIPLPKGTVKYMSQAEGWKIFTGKKCTGSWKKFCKCLKKPFTASQWKGLRGRPTLNPCPHTHNCQSCWCSLSRRTGQPRITRSLQKTTPVKEREENKQTSKKKMNSEEIRCKKKKYIFIFMYTFD